MERKRESKGVRVRHRRPRRCRGPGRRKFASENTHVWRRGDTEDDIVREEREEEDRMEERRTGKPRGKKGKEREGKEDEERGERRDERDKLLGRRRGKELVEIGGMRGREKRKAKRPGKKGGGCKM
jgi:hypothetical protein